jgi:hypothetical protein
LSLDSVPTEKTRPAVAAQVETLVLDDEEEDEKEQQMVPIPDGFVDDTDDEEMEQTALDLLEVLRQDVGQNAEDICDAEADDSLDGEAIEIR